VIRARWIVLAALGIACMAQAGPYAPRWFCSPLIFNEHGKPYPEEQSQDKLNEWAKEAGHSGVDLMDRILALDAPIAAKQVYRLIISRPAGPDTLWFAPILQKHWSPGERTYVCVVRGVEVPDSVRVILADGLSFMQAVERKRR
jgi:hypothetical protein